MSAEKNSLQVNMGNEQLSVPNVTAKQEYQCTWDWVPEMVTVCIIIDESANGDEPGEETCDIYPSPTEGNFEEKCEWVEVPDNEDPCITYGIDCPDPCAEFGIGCDGEGTQHPYNPPDDSTKTPCDSAKAQSDSATALSKNSNYISAITDIQNASTDGNEYVVSFGKSNGEIKRSLMKKGTSNSGTVPSIENRFADLHNHPNNSPPSSGDVYNFIDKAINNSDYKRFIVTKNGTVYALTLIDRQKAIDFNNNYPRQPSITDPATGQETEPPFPDEIVNEIIDMTQGANATEAMALAYIFEKYNTGLALLTQTNDGSFKRLNTKLEGVDSFGTKQFSSSDCPQ